MRALELISITLEGFDGENIVPPETPGAIPLLSVFWFSGEDYCFSYFDGEEIFTIEKNGIRFMPDAYYLGQPWKYKEEIDEQTKKWLLGEIAEKARGAL